MLFPLLLLLEVGHLGQQHESAEQSLEEFHLVSHFLPLFVFVLKGIFIGTSALDWLGFVFGFELPESKKLFFVVTLKIPHGL